VSLIKFAIMI